MKVIWIGNKYSDIKNCNNFFTYSINLYGPNNHNTFSFPYTRLSNSLNIANADKFINFKAIQILAEYPDALFMFYNPARVFRMSEIVKQHTTCLNSKSILKMLNNKSICHDLFSNLLKFAPYVNLSGRDISLEDLKIVFKNNTYIVQKPNSAGGLGTHIFSLNNEQKFKKLIQSDRLYLISSYIHNNISFNIHMLITEDGYISFPPSVQLIDITENGTFIFRGSDFINTDKINKEKLNQMLHRIADRLNTYNYLGIIGLDFIQDEKGEIYFIEFNCRFQASSFLINLAMKDYNLPSLQELNYKAFQREKIDMINNLSVPYASVIYYNGADSEIAIPNATLYYVEDDCLTFYKKTEIFSYLYKKVFKINTN